MVIDYGQNWSSLGGMEEMSISAFKARCLAILERVRRTRLPLRITRHGEPVAEIVPPSPPPRPDDWLGSMRGKARIVGDVVGPAADPGTWDALRS
jgi:prevent-host-death family protein